MRPPSGATWPRGAHPEVGALEFALDLITDDGSDPGQVQEFRMRGCRLRWQRFIAIAEFVAFIELGESV